jgi:hypothetical protein
VPVCSAASGHPFYTRYSAARTHDRLKQKRAAALLGSLHALAYSDRRSERFNADGLAARAHGTALDMSLIIPGCATQFDIHDLMRCIAPRALFVVSSDQDPSSADADQLVRDALPALSLERVTPIAFGRNPRIAIDPVSALPCSHARHDSVARRPA